MSLSRRWLARLLTLGCLLSAVAAGGYLTAVAPPVPPMPKAYPALKIHQPTPVPDRVVLTWKGDPTNSQAVTWRTDASVRRAYAEIAEAQDGPNFAGGRYDKNFQPRRLTAKTTSLKTDLGHVAYNHSVNFEGLQPDTLYAYRVGDGVNWSEWFHFRTASTEPRPFSFLYFGDAQNDIKSHWSRVIRQAYREAPDARFLLHAGDLINSANSDAEWGEWFTAAGWINGSIPSVPTPGNHEWFRDRLVDENGKRGEQVGTISRHWRQQFTLPENGPPGQEELVYYFDYQGVRFVSLNSNRQQSRSTADWQAQAEWLDRILTDNPCRWTIITFHHPIYSPAKNRDNPELRKLWQPVFDKHRVDLVLQGHDHTYARTGLMTAENDASGTQVFAPSGTVYCVSVSGPKMYKLNPKDWMVSSLEGKQLYQVIRIDGNKLRYQAYLATGQLHDVFELHKQRDGTNRLLERDELEALSSSWWQKNRTWAFPVFGLVGLAFLLLLGRVWRKA